MSTELATPLIVCGRQRAGTRFVANLLSSFETVTLQGELPNPVMRALQRFVTDVDGYYRKQAEGGRRERAYKAWLRKKEELVFALWSGVSQAGAIEPAPRCRYFGYKRPNNEFYFDFYETTFSTRSPMYVYCVRNFADNYLSIVSRWPDREIAQVADDFLASVRQYHAMKVAAPDRVLLFNLDDHIRLGFDYVERNVLRPLGLEPDTEQRGELAARGAANTTEGHLKRVRRRELTDEERIYIQENPELETEFAALCEA